MNRGGCGLDAGPGASLGNMAEWLRRVIRNHLEEIPREFESLYCRLFCADFWPSLGEQNPRGAPRTEV